jgi:hypothetical protein
MKKRCAIAVLLSIVAAVPARSDEARTYPPYPEVWGRELAAPAGRIVNGFYVRDLGTGDFLLAYAHRAADPQTGNLQGDGQWTRIDFFRGNPVRIAADEAERLTRGLPVPKARVGARTDPLKLANSIKIMPTSREPRGVGCWVNYAGRLMVLAPDDYVVARKAILRLLDQPEKREYWSGCERGRAEEHYLARADALSLVLYPLADGTFLAEGTQSPFMIRLRGDFTSPFIDTHPSLFVVDAAEIDRVVRDAYARSGAHIQLANDALYRYGLELRRKKASAR